VLSAWGKKRREREKKKREKTRVQIAVMKRGAAMLVFKNPGVPK